MIKKVKGFAEALHGDEKGSYFVEMALVLIGVALAVFSAASGLTTNALVPKYGEISNYINSVDPPPLTP